VSRLPYDVEQAIGTALAEIPGAHPEDQLDCVACQLPYPEFLRHADAIADRLGVQR
jgi:hypothetical protein